MPSRRNRTMLCLIRCGETTWDAEKRLLGAADLPLSESGRSSVAAAAAGHQPGPGPGPISHPPDEAAAETASLFAEPHGRKVKAVEELADPHLGLLEGLTERVFAERFPKRYKRWQDDPLSLSPPEGEDLADARSRLFTAVARLLRRSRSGEVVLVLHSLGLGFLRCWLSELPSRGLWTVLSQRPRVERYALTPEMGKWLEEAATPAASRT